LSKVIKKADSPNVRAEALDFSRLNVEAEAILDEAKRRAASLYAEATKILEEAKRISNAVASEKSAFDKTVAAAREESRTQGIAAGKKEGFEQGRAEGLKAGIDQVHREAYENAFKEKQAFVEGESKPALEMLAQIVETLQSEFDRIRTDARQELVHLAVSIAEKIVRREINLDPTVVLSTVHKAIDLSLKKHGVRVLVSPDDYSAVSQYLPNLNAAFARVDNITLVADESVKSGGCVVESGAGTVDMKIETQLLEIERALIGRKSDK
jgi:flagellar assembly protein FliH